MYEHLLDFYITKYEEKPLESYRNADGEIQFKDTGDEMVDRWEQQIADGMTPDLLESFNAESLAHIENLRATAKARDPYASIKDTFDAVAAEAKREHLHINKPTFGGVFDPDE